MSDYELNCCGLSCPEPVARCQKLLGTKQVTELTVLLDNAAAQENVSRFLSNRGYSIQTQQDGSVWKLTAKAADNIPKSPQKNQPANQAKALGNSLKNQPDAKLLQHPTVEQSKTLVFITTETLGEGSHELGGKLMENFLATLPELGEDLWRIILLNGGVKLAAIQGNALNSLKTLESMGVDILVCGTCLNFFDLYTCKAVGQTTNMLDVVTSLALADKVIRP